MYFYLPSLSPRSGAESYITLVGVAAILAAILYGRNQIQAKTAEKRQVEALVQVALSKLRDQVHISLSLTLPIMNQT